MKIEKYPHNKIRITGNGEGFIESQSVESNILYAVLNKLEEIRCGIIDVENAVGDQQ